MNPADLTAFLAAIEREVAAAFGLTVDDLYRQGRKRYYTWPRQIAMWMMRRNTNTSLNQIANRFHKKDHGTVLHAESQVQNIIGTDPEAKRQITAIQEKLTEMKQPPNCPKANLPIFPTAKDACAFFDALPAMTIDSIHACEECGGFHVYAHCREPSGASSGTGTRPITIKLPAGVLETGRRLSARDTARFRNSME